MIFPLSAYIGFRYAQTAKGNSFIAFINYFSIAGIALGLLSLITVLSVMNGFEGELKMRNLGITPHILIQQKLTSEQKRSIQDLPQVKATASHIQSEGLFQSTSGLKGVQFHGVESEAMDKWSVVSQNLSIGLFSELQPKSYNVIIGRALSIQLQIRVGDKVRLISSENSYFGPFGRIYGQRTFTVSGIYDMGSALDDKVVFINIQDAAKLLRTKQQERADLRLFLDDAFDYLTVSEQLLADNVTFKSWRTQQGPLFDAVKMEKNMMSLMLVLIIAVAAFNIVSALVMVVSEKRGDIAILLTQGMSRRSIMGIFLVNGAYNGIKGTLIGLVLGILLVNQINNILSGLNVPIFLGPDGQNLPIDLQYSQVAILVFVSLILCFVASLYPAYQASKIQPASALKYD